MVVASLLHILVEECSHVNLSSQELLLGLLRFCVHRACFLVKTGDYILLGVGAGAATQRV